MTLPTSPDDHPGHSRSTSFPLPLSLRARKRVAISCAFVQIRTQYQEIAASPDGSSQ